MKKLIPAALFMLPFSTLLTAYAFADVAAGQTAAAFLAVPVLIAAILATIIVMIIRRFRNNK